MVDANPSFPDAHGTFTVSAAHLDHMTEAHDGLAAFTRLLPGLSIADPRLIRPFRYNADRDRFLAGLRTAGLREDNQSQ